MKNADIVWFRKPTIEVAPPPVAHFMPPAPPTLPGAGVASIIIPSERKFTVMSKWKNDVGCHFSADLNSADANALLTRIRATPEVEWAHIVTAGTKTYPSKPLP